MASVPYALGVDDAGAQFGITKEAWLRLGLTGLGALAGTAAADRDEKTQGAVLGGVGGYLAGAGLSTLGHGLTHNPAQGTTNSANTLATQPLTEGPDGRPEALAQKLVRPLRGPARTSPTPIQAAGSGVAARMKGFFMGKPVGTNGARTLNLAERVMSRFPKLGEEKLADVNFGTGIPGTPLSVSFRARDERLPGMHRWVPREMIERAHAGLDYGLDPADVVDEEGSRGSLAHPLLGAAAGAALARFGIPNGGAGATALGALLGGGLGATVNQMTAPKRQDDMREALIGVEGERSNGFPVRGQQQSTASASTPMLLSSAGGVDT